VELRRTSEGDTCANQGIGSKGGCGTWNMKVGFKWSCHSLSLQVFRAEAQWQQLRFCQPHLMVLRDVVDSHLLNRPYSILPVHVEHKYRHLKITELPDELPAHATRACWRLDVRRDRYCGELGEALSLHIVNSWQGGGNDGPQRDSADIVAADSPLPSQLHIALRKSRPDRRHSRRSHP